MTDLPKYMGCLIGSGILFCLSFMLASIGASMTPPFGMWFGLMSFASGAGAILLFTIAVINYLDP